MQSKNVKYYNDLNLDQEIKNINLILGHNKARRKKSFIWPLNDSQSIDLILYRKLLQSFKKSKIKIKYCYGQNGLELIHNSGQYLLKYLNPSK